MYSCDGGLHKRERERRRENKDLVLDLHDICTHSAMYDIIRPLILPLLFVVVVSYACGIHNNNNNSWYADVLEIRKQNWFPVLIVGNKRDLFVANLQRATTLVHHSRRVPQRNVMGLKSFCGQDFRYEYKVDPGNHHAFRSNHHNHNHHSSTSSTTPTTTTTSTHSDTTARSTTENSFFLANRENWTTDNSYLDSLLNSEDASDPSVGALRRMWNCFMRIGRWAILTLRIVLFLCLVFSPPLFGPNRYGIAVVHAQWSSTHGSKCGDGRRSRRGSRMHSGIGSRGQGETRTLIGTTTSSSSTAEEECGSNHATRA